MGQLQKIREPTAGQSQESRGRVAGFLRLIRGGLTDFLRLAQLKFFFFVLGTHGKGNGYFRNLLSGNSSKPTLLRGDPHERRVTCSTRRAR